MIEEKLTGGCLKDRFKSFNNLVSSIDEAEFTPEFITSLSTKNELDLLYLAELAGRFKNPEVVCDLLKSENEAVVSKVLKNKWFFEGNHNREIFNPEYFAKNLLPYVTFATRSKIVTHIGNYLKDTKLVENFYHKISEIYGMCFAAKLIPACSEDFIKNFLKTEKTISKRNKENEDLILSVYRKYPKMVMELMYEDNKYRYVSVFDRLCEDYPSVYIEMFKKFPESISYCHLGYRTTLKVLEHDKNWVINKASDLFRYLNLEALWKKLKGDDRDTFIMNCFPKQMKDFHFMYNLSDLFKTFKLTYTVNYLIYIFKKKYDTDILSTSHFPSYLVEHLPIDKRCEWAQKKISEKNTREEDYLKYLLPKDVIKRCLFLINSSPDQNKRSDYLTAMLDCCKMNEDVQALLTVMKYVAERHRNDDEYLRYRFLDQLKQNFKLNELSSDHWVIIDEMLKIMIYNNEIVKNYRQSFLCSILQESVYYRLKNDIEIESVINSLFEYDEIVCLKNYPQYEETILNATLKKLKESIEDKLPKRFGKIVHDLIKRFFDPNTSNRSLNDYPWLLSVIKTWILGDDTAYFSNVLNELKKNKEMRKYFIMEALKNSYSGDVLLNVFTHETELLFDKMDLIIEKLRFTSNENIKCLHYMRSFLRKPLGDSFIQHLMHTITNYEEERSENYAKLLNHLSLLIDIDEYEDILKPLIPSETKIKVSDDPEKRAEYARTRVLLENFKYINPPPSYNMILAFAKDDYFKFILSSMLSISFKKSENLTIAFLKQLSEKPVSVKKHSVRLSYFLYPKKELLTLYTNMWTGQKNSSMRDIIFHRTFKIFEKEPDIEIASNAFVTIKYFLQSFEERDKNLFYYLHSTNLVRDEFLAEYVEISWNVLKKLDASGIKDISNNMNILINKVSANIEKMNEHFCELLNQEYFIILPKLTGDLFDALSNFCVVYLLQSQSKSQKDNITKFCTILKLFIINNWNVRENNFQYRTGIKYLLNTFSERAFCATSNVNSINLLESLNNMMKSVFPFEAIPQILLRFMFMISFMKISNQPEIAEEDVLKNFATEMQEKLSVFIDTYGMEALDVFIRPMDEIFIYFKHELFMKLRFIKVYLALSDKNRRNMLFAFNLIKSYECDETEVNKKIYNDILEEIGNFDDPMVKMAFGYKFERPVLFSSAE